MYEKGKGVSQNYGEAVKWFRLAAEQGHAKAQSNLGTMVPHIFTRKSRLQPGEFLISSAKKTFATISATSGHCNQIPGQALSDQIDLASPFDHPVGEQQCNRAHNQQ